jgi:hypothetical protein
MSATLEWSLAAELLGVMQCPEISMNRALLISTFVSLLGCSPFADRSRGEQTGSSRSAPASIPGAPVDSSAVVFVRSFYQTYAPRGAASGLAAVDSLLAEQPALFTPELLAALRRDAEARAAAKGEIDGLDWEPFLNSQDPCERYVVGDASRVASNVRVSVYAVCGGKRSNQSAVVAEVAPTGHSWAFANFIYGAPAGDLLKALRALHP